jgi:hypothetical protein
MNLEDIARANLKAIITAYRKGTGRSEAAVSKELYGNANFLTAFFAGEVTVSFRKMDEMLDLLRPRWAAGTQWPMGRVMVFKGPEKGKSSPENRMTA